MNERVFYIEPDADLSELTATLKTSKADTVIFVLSRKSMLFESIVNLQILRSEAEANSKNLILITTSGPGRKMAETAGIEAHPTLEHWEKKMPGNSVAAKKNPVPAETSKLKRVPIVVELRKDSEDEAPEELGPINWREFMARPSWQALAILVLFSVGLFFFLSFLALPGATVAIKPERKTLEIITNVELRNPEVGDGNTTSWKKDTISGFPIETTFSKTIDFPTITKVFRGQNASGTITIYNLFPEERSLQPSTRFQTEEGLVFRIADWAYLPPAGRAQNGTRVPSELQMTVTADEQDAAGEFIGERGNIEPSRLFLPGLAEDGRRNIWAESKTKFTNGVTAWEPQVTEDDLAAARNKIEEVLVAEAFADLENFLKEQNAREQRDLALFDGDQFLETEVSDVAIEEGVIGTARETFKVSGSIRVASWAYSQSELYQLVSEALSLRTDPKMRLVDIDFSRNAVDLMEKNERAGFWKVVITARGAEEFLIDPQSESGIRFVNKVKEEIAGLPIDEAEGVVANHEEVSGVSISVWPFWSRRIPRLPENISVRLNEASAEN